jgi:hypothetical protein
MTPELVREQLRRLPFVPLRIQMSDGSSYEIRHPDFANLTRRELVIFSPQTAGELPERMTFCDLLHVTRIEQLQAATAADN